MAKKPLFEKPFEMEITADLFNKAASKPSFIFKIRIHLNNSHSKLGSLYLPSIQEIYFGIYYTSNSTKLFIGPIAASCL